MTIDMDTYLKILQSFPKAPPESGGILGAIDDVVCAFVHDRGTASIDMAVYKPNVEVLNRTIRQWAEKGILFCGLAHSHPHRQALLSDQDVAYIYEIMNAMPACITSLYFPLVFPGEEIVSFVAIQQRERIDILPDNITII